MPLRVFYHDRCFDGACSAALFTRFHRECIGTAREFEYRGLVHRAGSLYEEAWFRDDGQNAIVDFKYSASPHVSWWFDHHQSAFASPEDEAHFYSGQKNPDGTPGPLALRQFFNPVYISCAGWIAHVASLRFGMDVGSLTEIIHWANIVDGAKYESAQAAVELRAPAMQLTLLMESADSSETVQWFIPRLTEIPLATILAEPFVQTRLQPLLERHFSNIDLLRQRIRCERGVMTFDITDQPMDGYNKFIPYYLHPEGTYNVGLSKSSFRVKVSVGTNPWTSQSPGTLANIAAICEGYGGGGHARVGAISFPADCEADARTAANKIATELRSRA